ncbi:MAG: hypothetical protein ABIN89_19075 [Chitinophagaceae bacterium]
MNWDFFFTEGRNSGKWITIPVPFNWELQGFGKYYYGFARDSSRGKEKGFCKDHFKALTGLTHRFHLSLTRDDYA